MKGCRRIVAGRWQCALVRAERRRNALYSTRICFPSFPRRGGAKRRGGFGACHHPAASGGTPPRRGGDRAESNMPRRIAIVEDDAAIRANYADALRKHGYEVSAHAARKEAMAAFKARLPHLALIDIGLGEEPDGGFALCRELRALSPGLPILFLT